MKFNTKEFDVVEGLAWSYETESYAGGSVCYL
jgi:hypothetical protein